MQNGTTRTLGRHLARELTADEIGSVSGGTNRQYTVRTNVGPSGDVEVRWEFDYPNG
jgi:hypothetical protein